MTPQKRPRTFAMIVNSKPDTCKCYRVTDFCRLNRCYGWYVMGGPDLGTAEKRLRDKLIAWKKLTNKPFVFNRQCQPKRAAFSFKRRWESLPLDEKKG